MHTTQQERRRDRDLNPGHLSVLQFSTLLASAARAPRQHRHNSTLPRYTQTLWRGRRGNGRSQPARNTTAPHKQPQQNTPNHTPPANARENHPARPADGLAGAKRVLGWSGARKAARSAYSESTASAASTSAALTPSAPAADSGNSLSISTRSTPTASTAPTRAATHST